MNTIGRPFSVDWVRHLRSYLDRVVFLRQGAPLSRGIFWLTAFVIANILVAAWLIVEFGYSSRLTATSSALDGSANLSSLWYGGDSEWIGSRVENWKVTVLRGNFDGGKVSRRVTVDLDRLTPRDEPAKVRQTAPPQQRTIPAKESSISVGRGATIPDQQAQRVLPAISTAKGSDAPIRSPQQRPLTRTETVIPVALSRDGSTLAWSWQRSLFVVDLQPERNREGDVSALSAREIVLRSASPISLIAFAAGNTLAAQDAESGLYLVDTEKGEVLYHEARRDGPCALLAEGVWILYACSGDREVVVLDSTRPKTSTRRARIAASGKLVFALSRAGEPAVATEAGSVLLLNPDTSTSPRFDHELKAPGAVGAMAIDGEYVAVGGGFRGVYLLGPKTVAQPIISDVPSVALIATRNLSSAGGELLYATREQAFSVRYGEIRSVSERGLLIALIFAVIVIGMLLAPALRVWVEMGRIKLKEQFQGEVANRIASDLYEPEASAPSLPLPDPPEELVKACASRECVAYLGAGMGAQAGLPTWPILVKDLLEYVAQGELIDPSFTQSLRAALHRQQYDYVADAIVSQLRDRPQILHDFLVKAFGDIRPVPAAYSLLKEIGFSAVLTTNFDRLLETSFGETQAPLFTYRDSEKLLEALGQKRSFLLLLYGKLSEPETVLLAPAEYVEAMSRNRLFSEFMDSLFFSRTLFFLGASLEGIETYLSGIQFRPVMQRKHFALVNVSGTAWRVKADLLERRYGIQVMPYTATDGFPELRLFLERLKTAVAPERSKAQAGFREASRLRSVKLVNIGPFEDVEFELDERWNVLLGDNGVGKTSVIRAIAAAIAGKAAEPYAHRLVKQGSNRAAVILKTNQGKEYTTDIEVYEGRARITSSAMLQQSEGWLAVGFPALRYISWARTKELPPEGERRPIPEDVLPLVRGDTDPRLDQIKSWFVNLDYLSSRGVDKAYSETLTKEAPGSYYLTLQRLLIGLIQHLTPGQNIRFSRIDPLDKGVYIETSDGILPIEKLSLGTSSLIGWVSVLLQRFCEVYAGKDLGGITDTVKPGSDDARSRQYALVLVDEIDAHLHPAWQQAVVHRLSEVFPQAQFIVTTHSPLIVGGMDYHQVVRLVRAESGAVERVPLSERTTMGRTDQLLTSRLFGLESTLDRKTENEVIKKYQELAAIPSRSEVQEREFVKLQDELDVRIPATGPALESRAKELIDAVLLQQFGDKFPEARKKALAAAEEILAELSTPRSNVR